MNAKKKAQIVIEAYALMAEASRVPMSALRNVVDSQQNRPPYGTADDSIDDGLWTELRDLCGAFESFARRFDVLIKRIEEKGSL